MLLPAMKDITSMELTRVTCVVIVHFLLLWYSPKALAQTAVSYDVPQDGYSVEESAGSIQVCVIVSGGVSSSFTLTITTLPSSAQAFLDYTPATESFTFMRTSGTTDCITINIVQDGILEFGEFFSIFVSSSDPNIVLPDPSVEIITIIDSNNVVLDFQNSSFSTNEGTTAQVCVVILAGVLGRPVSFAVTPSDGTATGSSDDFAPIPVSRTFQSNSESPLCFSMSITDDTMVEDDEMFIITLSSPDTPSDQIGTVIIRDNDGVSLALSSFSLSVPEGNSGTTALPLCMHLQDFSGGLERDVLLLLTTSFGSADASDFVTLTDEPYTLPSTTLLNQDVCFELIIIGDEIREGDETFMVTVTMGNSNDFIVGSNTATVTIQEDSDVIANCMPLSSPQNGNVQFNSTLEGSIALYTCITGYIVAGSSSRTCLSSGLWSDDDPTCQLEDCGPLDAPTNGGVIHEQTTYESVATYSCTIGYNLIGETTRMCQDNGSWSGMEPVCQIVDCGELSDPENGQVTYTSTVYQSQAVYSCETGYELSGTGSTLRICRANGRWTSFPPQCNPVDCGPLNDPDDGAVSLTGTTFMSTATYSCDSGHALIDGDQVRECQFNTSWSGVEPICQVDCGDLTVPSNGAISYTSGTFLGSTATYSCDLGYDLSGGDAVRICESDGEWSGNEPSGCQARDCGSPGVLDNGHVVLSAGTLLGSVANYSCNTGFSLNGVMVRECGTDGSWTDSVPTCMIVDCGGLLDPDNGIVQLSGTVFGSQANYSCVNGYKLVGVTTRTCLETQHWSDTAPSCQIVDCGVPNDPGHGDVTFTLTVFNAFALYSCEHGYNLVPDASIRTCQGDGNWSGDDRLCQPIDCGSLTNPMNGQVIAPQTTLGSVATYSCNPGYDLIGEDNITCQPSGLWSGGIPECLPVDCGSLSSPENGNVTLPGTMFDSIAQYTCNLGYLLVGVESRQCQADRTWSDESPICEAVDCGSLDNPEDGMVNLNGTRLDSVAGYYCNIGYELVGNIERRCTEQGIWSGNQPSCEIVQCTEVLSSPENGNLAITGNIYLSEAQYECDEGFAVVGLMVRVCQADGQWSGNEPHCEENMCPDLGNLDDGMIRITEVGFQAGLLATYECNVGYTISSFLDATRICQLSGEWTGMAPTCIINDCRQNPPPPVNGNVLTSGTTFGSRAIYFCDIGYDLYPTSDYERICLANETWSGFDPTCEPIDCGMLRNPMNGEVITNLTSLGSTASYRCNMGYELENDIIRVCQSNRSWSNNEPTCLDIDECLGDHECHQECVNENGGFRCECRNGFQPVDTFRCTDINECEDNNGGCAQLCNNTVGSFSCGCSEGYSLNTDDMNCNDIDECVLKLNICHENASCLNIDGSFDCRCDEGYEGNGFVCTDIDECMTEVHSCDINGLCNNTDGGFRCDCLSGYQGNGFICENVDECQLVPRRCHEDADCLDSDGSFSCSCKFGFIGDGLLCERQCSRMFQLLLSGVNNCQEWSLDSTDEKLVEIQQSVIAEVWKTCPTCDSHISHIQDGEFSCPGGSDSSNVLYRAILFGNMPVCDDLAVTVKEWVQSPQASLNVQSNLLQVAQNCMVEIDSFESKLDCPVPTTEVGSVLTEASSGTLTAVGTAAGIVGGILLISIVVLVIAVLVIVKKKKQKRFTLHTHFIDPDQQYTSLAHTGTPLHDQEKRRVHHNNYQETTLDTSVSTFNPDGNVLPTLGRSYSDLKRHYVQSPYAEIGEATVGNGKLQQDDFYEKVYDDGYHFDMEEVYDKVQRLSIGNLEDNTLERAVADNPLYEQVDVDIPEY